jgi:hypothetical protein
MDFMALLKQMMTPQAGPMDVRPATAGGPGLPPPMTKPAFPGFARRMGAGMTEGAATDSPLGAAANAFTAAREYKGGGMGPPPSIMEKLMQSGPAKPMGAGGLAPPTDLRPPAAGGPKGIDGMGGFMDKLGMLLGAL